MRRLLGVVFFLFALLAVNSLYLGAVTLLEYRSGEVYQNFFYLVMFLGHLVLGLALILPFVVFGVLHMRRARYRNNRYAIRAGMALFASGIAVLVSGIVLTRFGFFEVNDPAVRGVAYWIHIVAPFAAAWLFVLHRLAGRPIRWKTGLAWSGVAAGFAASMLGWHVAGFGHKTPPAEPAFATTLMRTPGGERLAEAPFMTDAFCAECHEDIAKGWEMSAHRLSSFNNPFYSFSVQETRRVSLESTGTVAKAQFCGGCHDIVPMVTGKFDDPHFDIVNDPSAHAGLTCTSCHAITRVNSVLGNADFTIAEPVQYPFETSDNPVLKEVSKQLIKAKPAFHRKGFLKPMHSTAEFCGTCHKAHMPVEVNDYKWLRGQNHYDSYMQSGIPGHRVDSFYYPPKAIENCAACHMPLEASDDPAARDFDGSGVRKVHSHFFPAANTGLAHAVQLPGEAIEAHRRMLEGAASIDLFGVRENGEIDGPLVAPLDAVRPVLQPGRRYLVEAVVRNRRVGHHLTQGTADSNELWVDVTVKAGEEVIGRSGARGPDGQVDPWAFFVNAYVLTRAGERLDRRNGQDTFVALYNHQIPPGAAAVVHYAITVPEDVEGPLTVEAALRYRKFDTTYLRYVEGDAFDGNDLPIVTLGSDRIELSVEGAGEPAAVAADNDKAPAWQRWNDYGIGLLLAGTPQKSTLRQAEEAFRKVEELGRPDGPLNLARVYLKEGRVDEAAAALQRAADTAPAFRPWTRAWLTALVDRENGHLDNAIATLRALLDTRFAEARERGFDFGYDYRARAMLGRTLYERARLERGERRRERRLAFLEQAQGELETVLTQDPENLEAHYNLALVYDDLGDEARAAEHRALVQRYRPDDHAIEQAVAVHRRNNPAADHAAEPVTVYDLQRTAPKSGSEPDFLARN
jgi:tetratricopeptide (TPR) repeat protein